MSALERIIEKSGRTEELYAARVSAMIRERYSVDAELAILRQRDDKPEEFAAYNAYAEDCKARARAELELSNV